MQRSTTDSKQVWSLRIADMWIAQLPTDYNIGHSHCMFDKDVTAYFLLV